MLYVKNINDYIKYEVVFVKSIFQHTCLMRILLHMRIGTVNMLIAAYEGTYIVPPTEIWISWITRSAENLKVLNIEQKMENLNNKNGSKHHATSLNRSYWLSHGSVKSNQKVSL